MFLSGALFQTQYGLYWSWLSLVVCVVLVQRVLAHMVNFLENHRHVEGIFRISGTNRRLKLLRVCYVLTLYACDGTHLFTGREGE